jgi:hypothetical protein
MIAAVPRARIISPKINCVLSIVAIVPPKKSIINNREKQSIKQGN